MKAFSPKCPKSLCIPGFPYLWPSNTENVSHKNSLRLVSCSPIGIPKFFCSVFYPVTFLISLLKRSICFLGIFTVVLFELISFSQAEIVALFFLSFVFFSLDFVPYLCPFHLTNFTEIGFYLCDRS